MSEFNFELFTINDAWKQCSVLMPPFLRVRCGLHAVYAVENAGFYLWRCIHHKDVVEFAKDGSVKSTGPYTRTMYRRVEL